MLLIYGHAGAQAWRRQSVWAYKAVSGVGCLFPGTVALLVVRKKLHLGAYLNRIVKSDNAEHFLLSVDILYAMMPHQMTM